MNRRLVLLLAGPIMLLASGCFGPTTVRQTRDRYNEAIRETNNEELLLNLVRLRYNEHPSFLPITGLNAQFSLSAGPSIAEGRSEGASTTSATVRSATPTARPSPSVRSARRS